MDRTHDHPFLVHHPATHYAGQVGATGYLKMRLPYIINNYYGTFKRVLISKKKVDDNSDIPSNPTWAQCM